MRKLTLIWKGEPVQSGGFDMKAFRIMHEALIGRGVTALSLDGAALAGLASMFEESGLTEEMLLSGGGIGSDELMNACDSVIRWYTEAAGKAKKRQPGGTEGQDGGGLLSIYKSLLTSHLPGDIDRQDAVFFMEVLCSEASRQEGPDAEDYPEHLREYYEV